MVQVSLSYLALDNMYSIYSYISKESVFYAENVINAILNRISILESHPHIGRIVPEYNNRNVREIFEGSYRIIYEIQNSLPFAV